MSSLTLFLSYFTLVLINLFLNIFWTPYYNSGFLTLLFYWLFYLYRLFRFHLDNLCFSLFFNFLLHLFFYLFFNFLLNFQLDIFLVDNIINLHVHVFFFILFFHIKNVFDRISLEEICLLNYLLFFLLYLRHFYFLFFRRVRRFQCFIWKNVFGWIVYTVFLEK